MVSTANKVKVGFFSFTEITDPSQHHSYNEWHQLDHMPEQFPLGGVAHGQRWVATPACRKARAAARPPLDATHYMTLYLMTEPVERTLDEFYALGRHLHEVGRFHEHRRAHLSGPLALVGADAAPRVLISAQAVPYRPNRGIYVIVEEPGAEGRISELTGVPGVAGAWVFESSDRYPPRRRDAASNRITVCYLDDDPLVVAARLDPLLANAPAPLAYAGPLETIAPWQWDWFDTDG